MRGCFLSFSLYIPINQNLEAMAKQLYDYWFVQFDFPDENGRPYKSNGGEMVWNKKLKREIPKGWNVLKLGERCSFNKRTSSGYFNHSILYLDTSNITNNTIDELQFLNPSSDIIPSRARRLVQEGDIVYSTVRPNLKHFGIIMNPDYNMVVSTGFAVITANWSAYRYFIYQFLIQAATIENLSTIAQSAVSAYPSINTSDIENLDLVVPPDSMIEKYAKTACRLYLQIDTNYKEIKSLTKQRDELLPLLMNGQVSVNSDLSKCISKIGIVALIRNYPNSLLKYWRLVIIYKCRITFSYNFSSHFASLPSPSQISSTSSDRLLPPRLVGDRPSGGRKWSLRHHWRRWRLEFRI